MSLNLLKHYLNQYYYYCLSRLGTICMCNMCLLYLSRIGRVFARTIMIDIHGVGIGIDVVIV